MISLDNKHIKNLVDASVEGTLGIFVGAGISKSSETGTLKLPNWSDLITDLKKDLSFPKEHDFLKIAQLYYLEFGESVYYKKLRDYFPDYLNPSSIHNLIFEIRPSAVITTNWDTILEKTIEENAYLYDTVVEDADLVKSNNPRRLIKMHGDFKHHNVVFKEDDYLNYKFNFPLIENYIKSILSTHVVLFLGYSYNDFNLKQIAKWIQHYSKVKPPMYLVTYEKNNTQAKYLESHGITSLCLNTENRIDIDHNKLTHEFLLRIKDYDSPTILASEEETIDFVYNRLKHLSGLHAVLFEQIENALTNCDFLFLDDLGVILEFYTHESKYDPDDDIRKIYKKFVSILADTDKKTKTPTKKLLAVFQLLIKGDVLGIIISDRSTTEKEYIPFGEYIVDTSSPVDDLLNFSYGIK